MKGQRDGSSPLFAWLDQFYEEQPVMFCEEHPTVLARQTLSLKNFDFIGLALVAFLTSAGGCATHRTFNHRPHSGAAGMAGLAGSDSAGPSRGGAGGLSNSAGGTHTTGGALGRSGGEGDTPNRAGCTDGESDGGASGEANGGPSPGGRSPTQAGMGGRLGSSGGANAGTNPMSGTGGYAGSTRATAGAGGMGAGGRGGVGGMSGSGGNRSCSITACTVGTTECANGGVRSCEKGSDGCGAWQVLSTCSAPLVCERYTGPTCADSNWAEWSMPNSPTETGIPNTESYTDNGNGTVTDNVTRLMWEQASSTSTYSWTDAVIYCSSESTGGHNDWRVPSMIELASLLDLGRSNPAINPVYFPDTPPTHFWSASGDGSTYIGWYVDFSGGPGMVDEADFTTELFNVRCVR